MTKILDLLILPREITQFERVYLRRVNRVALAFFALHVPAFAIIALANHTGSASAALLTLLVLLGPTIAYLTLANPRSVSIIHGISAIFMGGLLVHFGQGPAQIEMHCYFFAVLAMCSVVGNPMVIVTSTVTVALHHLVVWLALPSSVFNYDAQGWVVGIHALFVILEAVATCFIARSFFDNVIGLERKLDKAVIELKEAQIINAAHAIGERAEGQPLGKIAVRTRSAGEHAVIEIADDGAGIPEAIRHRIFEPFFTTKPQGQGTGQGLAISYGVIVDKHHGTIAVDSEPGHGTQFTITLPIHEAEALAA